MIFTTPPRFSAYLLGEPGAEAVVAASDRGAGVGTANLAAVMTRLVRRRRLNRYPRAACWRACR